MLSRLAKEPADDFLLFRNKRGFELIVGKAQVLAAGPLSQQFRVVVGIVQQSLLHFFAFCHLV